MGEQGNGEFSGDDFMHQEGGNFSTRMGANIRKLLGMAVGWILVCGHSRHFVNIRFGCMGTKKGGSVSPALLE
jgi:hypothetical protein